MLVYTRNTDVTLTAGYEYWELEHAYPITVGDNVWFGILGTVLPSIAFAAGLEADMKMLEQRF